MLREITELNGEELSQVLVIQICHDATHDATSFDDDCDRHRAGRTKPY